MTEISLTEIDDCHFKNNIYGNTDSRAAIIRFIGNRKNDLPNTVPFLLPYPFLSPPFSTLLYSSLLYSTLLYSTLLYSTLLYSTLLFSSPLSPPYLLFVFHSYFSQPCDNIPFSGLTNI